MPFRTLSLYPSSTVHFMLLFQRREQHLQRVRARLHVVHERPHDLRAEAHRRGLRRPRRGLRHARQVQAQGEDIKELV